MKNSIFRTVALSAGILMTPMVSQAAIVTVGPGGFDAGWATEITYDNDLAAMKRGTANGRDNGANALGANDGDFFELGYEGWAEFTFGTSFDTSVTIFEVTFGTVANWYEEAEVWVKGGAGAFNFAGTISNAAAQGGGSVSLIGFGVLDTVKLIDNSPVRPNTTTGGFDVDAVRVSPVPIPAAAWLFGSALLGFFGVSRRRKLKA